MMKLKGAGNINYDSDTSDDNSSTHSNDDQALANEDPSNFTFQRVFGEFDTKYIKSGHSINIRF